ncbi:hypothetical protein [Massilia sp. SYSU DXS3249]
MEQYITADRIANAICQDTVFKGFIVLIEGKKDQKLYSKFFNKQNARLVQTFGKYKQRDAYQILSDRGFLRKIAIRDADYLRIPGNNKYDAAYNADIFPTDYHDSEIMIANSRAFDNFISVLFDEEKLSAYEKAIGKDFRSLIFELAYVLGCLKLANKRYNLGLSFKPARVDGNKLKINKFLNLTGLPSINKDVLINTIYEYSKNRDAVVAQRAAISQKLDLILAENYPILEVCNGHDVCEIISILSKDALKNENKALQNADTVEDMLRLAFDNVEFMKTNLANLLNCWQQKSGKKIFA